MLGLLGVQVLLNGVCKLESIALVFPGQGSQYLGMCEDLINYSPSYQFFFEKASETFEVDFFSFCKYGPNEKLASTNIAQPVILIHSLIIDKILKQNKIKISAVAGHSLGEYSALVSSGVISFDDCLKILKIRCKQMQLANEKNNGGMLAVINDNLDLISDICKNFSKTVIANINSKNQIIISGPIVELDKSIEIFKSNNIRKIIKLNVSGAFHSPLMEQANVSLNKAINSVNFNDTKIPIYQNVSPIENFKGETIRKNLLKQLTSSVQWYQTIVNMHKNGINKIIELGPKQVLTKLIKKINPNIKTISLDSIEDLMSNGLKIIK